MNEDLLRAMMEGVDPARDLTNETLDELMPHDHLMAKITAGIGSEAPERQAVRVPIWRRVSALVGAGAAAVTLAVVGAVTLLGSAPVVIQGTALGPMTTHRGQVSGGATATNGDVYGAVVTGAHVTNLVSASDVVNGRFVKTVWLDGGVLRVTPAPKSLHPTVTYSQMTTTIWATSQIEGYRKVVMGFGLVSLTKHNATVKATKNLPAWVGMATTKGDAFSCPARPGTTPLPNLALLPSSGLAAVVNGFTGPMNRSRVSTSPSTFVYVAKSAPCGYLVKPRLTVATEQVSVPWTQDGPVTNGVLRVKAGPLGCGTVQGYSVSGNRHSVTVTVQGLVPEYLLYEYCPMTRPVNVVVRLEAPSPGSPPSLVTSTTKILHSKIGPIRATR